MNTSPSEAQQRLAPFRREIDALDSRIIALLGERFAVVHKVAELKAEHGIPVVLPDRIDQVIQQARETAKRVGFDPAVAEQIYRVLLDASCRMEVEFMAAKGDAGK